MYDKGARATNNSHKVNFIAKQSQMARQVRWVERWKSNLLTSHCTSKFNDGVSLRVDCKHQQFDVSNEVSGKMRAYSKLFVRKLHKPTYLHPPTTASSSPFRPPPDNHWIVYREDFVSCVSSSLAWHPPVWLDKSVYKSSKRSLIVYANLMSCLSSQNPPANLDSHLPPPSPIQA